MMNAPLHLVSAQTDLSGFYPLNVLLFLPELSMTSVMILFLFIVIVSLSMVLYSRLIFSRKLNRYLDLEITSRNQQLSDVQSALAMKNEEIKRLSEKILNQQAQLVLQQQVLKKSVDELKKLHQSTDLNLQEVLRKGPSGDLAELKKSSSRIPIGSGATEKTNSKSEQEFLQKITALVEKNLTNADLDHRLLCEQLSMSKSVFYGRFKSVAGVGLQEFIKVMRLKRSIKLLLAGNMNIQQIALEVGFNSQSYYNKCFIRQYGMGPKAYSKAVRESNLADLDTN